MKDLTKLKFKRNALKTNIKKLLKIAEECLSDEEINISEATVILEKLERYHLCLIDFDNKILDLMDEDEEIQIDIEECSLFQDELIDKISQLSVVNKKATGFNNVQKNNSELIEIEKQKLQIEQEKLEFQKKQFLDRTNVNVSESSVKLPKLDIACFDGSVLQWQEFWDTYEKAVHKNSKLSSIEKFSYLKSKVKGDAQRAISGLNLSSDNYQIAIDLLKARFGNKQRIIQFHYIEIMNMTPTIMRTSKLRVMYDKLEIHFRSLAALGENVDQNVFIPMITCKLPREILRELELRRGDDEWTALEIRKTLGRLISAREASELHTDGEVEPKEKVSHSHHDKYQPKAKSYSTSFPSSAEALVVGEQTFYRKCIYCERFNHYSDECNKYKTLSERKEQIKNRCYICLRDNHRASDCRLKTYCFHCNESGNHHRSLCPKKFPMTGNEEVGRETSSEHLLNKGEGALVASGERVIMQSAVGKAKNPKTNMEANANILLDTGSHRTYISRELSKSLNLKMEETEDIPVMTFGTQKQKLIQTKLTSLEIIFKDGTSISLKANIVPSITGKIQRYPSNLDFLKHVTPNMEMAEAWPEKLTSVDILIGNDYYLDVILPERKQVKEGLYLINSRLGWMFSGRFNEEKQEENSLLTYGDYEKMTECMMISISPNIETFWNLETVGIKLNEEDSSEMQILDEFEENIKFEQGRYYVTWPWRNISFCELPTNKEMSAGRFRSLVRRLQKDEELFNKYDIAIKEQEKNGIIEQGFPERVENGRIHYLPHHPVITPGKSTTKVRIVYDASAKTNKEGNSLNDCLYRGPLILRDLCGLLLRFRLNRTAIVADIEKAFLQVGLQQDERNVTRFFWIKDIKKTPTCENIITYRFCRVPFGVVSSPFLLSATIRHHLKKFPQDLTEQLGRDIYVDNLITGVETVEQAVELYKEAKEIFGEAVMNLREWNSNDKEFMSMIDTKDRMKEENLRVLGIMWNTKSDLLNIANSHIETSSFTKRNILKIIASIYDPLGYFSPISVRAKIFFQDLWRDHIDWDEELPKEKKNLWTQIQYSLESISSFHLQRYLGSDTMVNEATYYLACFCDASNKAYAATIYLVITSETEELSNLIFAKTRLAPKKEVSIPRLELLAVVMGVRSLNFVKRELSLEISRVILWTDSQCVLHWIGSEKKLDTFVENRIKEIRLSENIEYSYISTRENPADLPTRGVSVEQLRSSDLWWHGPNWIKNYIPDFINEKQNQMDATTEVEEMQFVEGVFISGEETKEIKAFSPYEIDSKNFSSLSRLLRVTAWCNRFVNLCKKDVNPTGILESDDILKAKIMWEYHIQQDAFGDTFYCILKKKKCSLVHQLNLFVDKNKIIRCYSRLAQAEVDENTKYPKLLPRKNHFTKLVIEAFHRRVFHSGVSHTLLQVRQEYWVPRGRTEVKMVLKNCKMCQRVEGGPFSLPPMPPLPEKRVRKSIPFLYTGLDYLGPLYIKTTGGQEKVWVCLFTCMSIRAVHLEVVNNMTSEEFLLCMRRFIARCGKPEEITLDNAPQFKLVKDVFDRVWMGVMVNPDVKNFISNENIKWKFITELAPWMGGMYERLVGLVKRALRKTIGRVCLTFIQLQTIIVEVEAMINSRPLVYIDNEIESTTLTPSDFLFYNTQKGTPELYDKEIENDQTFQTGFSSADELINSWKKGQKHLDRFWKIWQEQYLISLRDRMQSTLKGSRNSVQHNPVVGNVVLIKENLPRGAWRLGRIERLISSHDQLIRSAVVRLSTGRCITRSLSHLFPIECSSTDQHEEDVENINELTKEEEKLNESKQHKKQTRTAAIKARTVIKQQLT